MRFIKHAKGEFWACSAFPACKKTLKSDGDKPAVGKHPQASSKYACKQCGKGLIRRKTKDGKFFWGCSDYPSCRSAYSDQDGKPNYAARDKKGKK
jgi:ssDNA-binding Zn-finger/Zn-ribbon topoisomerase 1